MAVDPIPSSRAWRLGIRLAGQLIADGGRTTIADAQRLARRTEYTQVERRSDGSNKGAASTRRTTDAVRWLARHNLVTETDGVIVASDLPDLAAWIADELEDHAWTSEG